MFFFLPKTLIDMPHTNGRPIFHQEIRGFNEFLATSTEATFGQKFVLNNSYLFRADLLMPKSRYFYFIFNIYLWVF